MRLAFFLIILSLIFTACSSEKEAVVDRTNLPYPADEDLMFYQNEADSGYMTFRRDIKRSVLSYMGNSKYNKYKLTADNVRIRGEGLFIGTVEVETKDFLLVIRLERPFKSKGRNSIWQVILVVF
jgi:hypothetical protein